MLLNSQVCQIQLKNAFPEFDIGLTFYTKIENINELIYCTNMLCLFYGDIKLNMHQFALNSNHNQKICRFEMCIDSYQIFCK